MEEIEASKIWEAIEYRDADLAFTAIEENSGDLQLFGEELLGLAAHSGQIDILPSLGHRPPLTW